MSRSARISEGCQHHSFSDLGRGTHDAEDFPGYAKYVLMECRKELSMVDRIMQDGRQKK